MILVLHSIYDLGAVWYLLPPSPTQFGLGGSEKNFHCEIESQRLSANTSCNFCDRKNLKKVCRSGENSYNLPILAVAVCRRPWHQPGTVRQSSGAARLPRQSPVRARAAVQSTRGGEAEAGPQLRKWPRLPSILSRLLRGTPSLKLPHGSCSWKLPQLKTVRCERRTHAAASGETQTAQLAAYVKTL